MNRQVIKDNLTGPQILKITSSDFDSSFQEKIQYNQHILYKENQCSDGIYGKFSLTGKSGVTYKFVVHKLYNNGTELLSYGLSFYIVVPVKFNKVYYTMSIDDDDEILLRSKNKQINRYTEHLINRYNERCGISSYGEDGFIKFIVSNPGFNPVDLDNDDSIVGFTKDGAVLGHKRYGKNVFDTFYSKKMILDNNRLRSLYAVNTKDLNRYIVNTESSFLQRLYEAGKISHYEMVSRIFKLFPIQINGELRQFITRSAQETLCTCKSAGCAHIKARSQRLCVESLVYRHQTGMLNTQAITPRMYLQSIPKRHRNQKTHRIIKH